MSNDRRLHYVAYRNMQGPCQMMTMHCGIAVGIHTLDEEILSRNLLAAILNFLHFKSTASTNT